MIIVMKPQAAESSITAIKEYIEGSGLNAHLSQGTEVTIIGVVGDKSVCPPKTSSASRMWTESSP